MNPSLILFKLIKTQNMFQDTWRYMGTGVLFGYFVFFPGPVSLRRNKQKCQKILQKTCSLQIARLVLKDQIFLLRNRMEVLTLELLWTARMALSSCSKAKNLDQKVWNGFRKSSQISYAIPAHVAKGITSAASVLCSAAVWLLKSTFENWEISWLHQHAVLDSHIGLI